MISTIVIGPGFDLRASIKTAIDNNAILVVEQTHGILMIDPSNFLPQPSSASISKALNNEKLIEVKIVAPRLDHYTPMHIEKPSKPME